MTSVPLALAVAAVLSAAPGDPPLHLPSTSPWEIGASLGGGWESNALAASAPVASSFGAARAWVARRFEPSDVDGLWLQLHYDGARYASVPEADLDRPELSLEWDHAFGDRVTTRATGRAALRLQGESSRSGWDAGGRALLRVRLGEVIGLRLGAGFTHREARDAALSWSSGRADAGVDVALWRGASVIGGYTLEVGTDTFYSTPSGGWAGYRGGAGASGGSMGGGTIDGAARPGSRVAHGLAADVLQLFPGGVFLQAGYGIALERGGGTSYLTHSVLAEIGWRR